MAKAKKTSNKAKKPVKNNGDKTVTAWADLFKTEIEFLGIGYK